MKIVIWTPEVNHHNIDTWKEIQKQAVEPMICVAWQLLTKTHSSCGWVVPDINNLNIIEISNKDWWKQGIRILLDNSEAIHIFAGFWTVRPYFPLFIYALIRGIKVCVLNESYSTSLEGYYSDESSILLWIKARLRPVLYRILAKLIVLIAKNSKPCLLPISLIAKNQFIHAGFDEESMFPFGYFITKRSLGLTPLKNKGDGLKLVFIGSLIKIKGLDVAVKAVESLFEQGHKLFLDVYGPGDPNLYFSPTSRCIVYKGTFASGEAQKIVGQYDLLILPSHHDGWGVVVNEALLQGIPVIVSDRVGAKCLVENSGAGIIYRDNDPEDLMRKLESIILDTQKIKFMNQSTLAVGTKILPEVAAAYLIDVFNYYFSGIGQRPTAIWCE